MVTRKNSFTAAAVFFLFAALLLNCSSRPTDRQSRADLQKWFDRRWPETVSVVEYLKTGEEGDGKQWTVHYRARLKFVKDTRGCVSTCCGDICFDKQIDGFRWVTKRSDNPYVVQKGDLFEVEGKHAYSRTDKGWVNEDLK